MLFHIILHYMILIIIAAYTLTSMILIQRNSPCWWPSLQPENFLRRTEICTHFKSNDDSQTYRCLSNEFLVFYRYFFSVFKWYILKFFASRRLQLLSLSTLSPSLPLLSLSFSSLLSLLFLFTSHLFSLFFSEQPPSWASWYSFSFPSIFLGFIPFAFLCSPLIHFWFFLSVISLSLSFLCFSGLKRCRNTASQR